MSKFNFIYAEDLSHREKTVYIYLRDRADASPAGDNGGGRSQTSTSGTARMPPASAGRGSRPSPVSWASHPAPSSGPWQIWNTGSSLRSGSATAPTAALPAICTA